MTATVQAHADEFQKPKGPCTEQETVKAIIWCAANWFNVSLPTALEVAECESGFNAEAVSPTGTYLGVYQQSRFYWRERFQSYIPNGWFPNLETASAFNPRANILVSLIMAKTTWSHWSGCL